VFSVGLAVLTFRDVTTGRTTDDGPTSAAIAYLAFSWSAKVIELAAALY